MKTETDKTPQAPEDVLNELRTLVAEAERILGEPSRGACNCDTALDALRQRLDAAQARATDLYRQSKEKVVRGAKYADETIRDHPYQSIAAALGVGLLAGVLLGRRWNSTPQ